MTSCYTRLHSRHEGGSRARLKNRLSEYLRLVARGEMILVTDRGRVVAELRRPSSTVSPTAVSLVLERLHADGIPGAGLPQDKAVYRSTRVRMKAASQSLLDADRGER